MQQRVTQEDIEEYALRSFRLAIKLWELVVSQSISKNIKNRGLSVSIIKN